MDRITSRPIVPRKTLKKVLMHAAGQKNNWASTLLGQSIGMTEYRVSFSDRLVFHDVYKILFHAAIPTSKQHKAMLGAQYAGALVGGLAGEAGVSSFTAEVGASTSDAEGFRPDMSGLSTHFREANYRTLKKGDRWQAARQCAQIIPDGRFLVHLVTLDEREVVMYYSNIARSVSELERMFNNRVAWCEAGRFPPFSMEIRRFNLDSGIKLQAAGELPTWAALDPAPR